MKLELQVDEVLPLRNVVFNTLRQAIIQGGLKPGERLMEVTLARKLGVSRTPVREAIRMLELEGLVIMVPRRGAEVAKITEKDLKDALEVRVALEDLAVKLACERIDEEGIKELTECTARFKEAVNSEQVSQIVQCDEDFHNCVYKITKNPKLIQLAQNLREQVYRYRVEYVKDFTYHGKLVEEHDMITEAIIARDADKAQQLMEEHIYNQEQTVIRNVKNS